MEEEDPVHNATANVACTYAHGTATGRAATK